MEANQNILFDQAKNNPNSLQAAFKKRFSHKRNLFKEKEVIVMSKEQSNAELGSIKANKNLSAFEQSVDRMNQMSNKQNWTEFHNLSLIDILDKQVQTTVVNEFKNVRQVRDCMMPQDQSKDKLIREANVYSKGMEISDIAQKDQEDNALVYASASQIISQMQKVEDREISQLKVNLNSSPQELSAIYCLLQEKFSYYNNHVQSENDDKKEQNSDEKSNFDRLKQDIASFFNKTGENEKNNDELRKLVIQEMNFAASQGMVELINCLKRHTSAFSTTQKLLSDLTKESITAEMQVNQFVRNQCLQNLSKDGEAYRALIYLAYLRQNLEDLVLVCKGLIENDKVDVPDLTEELRLLLSQCPEKVEFLKHVASQDTAQEDLTDQKSDIEELLEKSHCHVSIGDKLFCTDGSTLTCFSLEGTLLANRQTIDLTDKLVPSTLSLVVDQLKDSSNYVMVCGLKQNNEMQEGIIVQAYDQNLEKLSDNMKTTATAIQLLFESVNASGMILQPRQIAIAKSRIFFLSTEKNQDENEIEFFLQNEPRNLVLSSKDDAFSQKMFSSFSLTDSDGKPVVRKPSDLKSLRISGNLATIEFTDCIQNYHILTGKFVSEHKQILDKDAKLIYLPNKNMSLNLFKDMKTIKRYSNDFREMVTQGSSSSLLQAQHTVLKKLISDKQASNENNDKDNVQSDNKQEDTEGHQLLMQLLNPSFGNSSGSEDDSNSQKDQMILQASKEYNADLRQLTMLLLTSISLWYYSSKVDDDQNIGGEVVVEGQKPYLDSFRRPYSIFQSMIVYKILLNMPQVPKISQALQNNLLELLTINLKELSKGHDTIEKCMPALSDELLETTFSLVSNNQIDEKSQQKQVQALFDISNQHIKFEKVYQHKSFSKLDQNWQILIKNLPAVFGSEQLRQKVTEQFFNIIDGKLEECQVPQEMQETFVDALIGFGLCKFVSDSNNSVAISFLNEVFASATETLLKIDANDLSTKKWAVSAFGVIMTLKVGAVLNADEMLQELNSKVLHELFTKFVKCKNNIHAQRLAKILFCRIASKTYQLINFHIDPIQSDDDKVSKQSKFLIDSNLISGGIEDRYINMFSEQTLKMGNEFAETSQDSQLLKIFESSSPQLKSDASAQQQDNILKSLVTTSKNELVESTLKYMKQIVKRQGGQLAMVVEMGNQQVNQIINCAFAVMLKLSGLVGTYQALMDRVETEQDLASTIVQEEHEADLAIRQALKEEADFDKVLNLFKKAQNMRQWYSSKKLSIAEELKGDDKKKDEQDGEKIDTDDKTQQEEAKMEELISSISEKAQFLIKLQAAQSFKFDSGEALKSESSMQVRAPSYIEGVIKDEQEQQEGIDQNNWKEQLASWKADWINNGTIVSVHDQKQKKRDQGLQAVMLCLQNDIEVQTIQNLLEQCFIKSVQRAAYLSLLDELISSPDIDCELIFHISPLLFKLDNDQKISHYLDHLNGISSGGSELEQIIKVRFFNILKTISQQIGQVKNVPELKKILNCFEWNFMKRDHQKMTDDLKIFSLIRFGYPNNTNEKNILGNVWRDPDQVSIVLESFQHTFLNFISKLTEQDQKNVTQDEGLPTLSRAKSIVNTNKSEELLTEAIEVMYKEFEVIVASYSPDLDTLKLNNESETKALLVSELEWAKTKPGEFREVKDQVLETFLDLNVIFSSVSLEAPYVLDMVKHLANPYQIYTLLKLLVIQTTPDTKNKVLKIIQNLLTISIPTKVFDLSAEMVYNETNLMTKVPEFQHMKELSGSRFLQLLYQVGFQTLNLPNFNENRSLMLNHQLAELIRTLHFALDSKNYSEWVNHMKQYVSKAFSQFANIDSTEQILLLKVMKMDLPNFVKGSKVKLSDANQTQGIFGIDIKIDNKLKSKLPLIIVDEQLDDSLLQVLDQKDVIQQLLTAFVSIEENSGFYLKTLLHRAIFGFVKSSKVFQCIKSQDIQTLTKEMQRLTSLNDQNEDKKETKPEMRTEDVYIDEKGHMAERITKYPKSYPSGYNHVICNYCRKHIYADKEFWYHCQSCQYDCCENCLPEKGNKKTRVIIQCNKGHDLHCQTLYPEYYPRNGYNYCDDCNNREDRIFSSSGQNPGSNQREYYHCKQCEYDLCDKCYLKKINVDDFIMKCNNDHQCEYRTSKPSHYGGVRCDTCSSLPDCSKGFYHCPKCSFDECRGCSNKRKYLDMSTINPPLIVSKDDFSHIPLVIQEFQAQQLLQHLDIKAQASQIKNSDEEEVKESVQSTQATDSVSEQIDTTASEQQPKTQTVMVDGIPMEIPIEENNNQQKQPEQVEPAEIQLFTFNNTILSIHSDCGKLQFNDTFKQPKNLNNAEYEEKTIYEFIEPKKEENNDDENQDDEDQETPQEKITKELNKLFIAINKEYASQMLILLELSQEQQEESTSQFSELKKLYDISVSKKTFGDKFQTNLLQFDKEKLKSDIITNIINKANLSEETKAEFLNFVCKDLIGKVMQAVTIIVAQEIPEAYKSNTDELAESTLSDIEMLYHLTVKDLKLMKMFLNCILDLILLTGYRNSKFQQYEVKYFAYAAKFLGIIARNLNWKDDLIILQGILPEEKDAQSVFLKLINQTEQYDQNQSVGQYWTQAKMVALDIIKAKPDINTERILSFMQKKLFMGEDEYKWYAFNKSLERVGTHNDVSQCKLWSECFNQKVLQNNANRMVLKPEQSEDQIRPNWHRYHPQGQMRGMQFGNPVAQLISVGRKVGDDMGAQADENSNQIYWTYDGKQHFIDKVNAKEEMAIQYPISEEQRLQFLRLNCDNDNQFTLVKHNDLQRVYENYCQDYKDMKFLRYKGRGYAFAAFLRNDGTVQLRLQKNDDENKLNRAELNLGKNDQDEAYKAKQIELHHDDEISENECFIIVLTMSGIVLKAKASFDNYENIEFEELKMPQNQKVTQMQQCYSSDSIYPVFFLTEEHKLYFWYTRKFYNASNPNKEIRLMNDYHSIYNCAWGSNDNTKIVKFWCTSNGAVFIQCLIEDKWLQLRAVAIKEHRDTRRSLGIGQIDDSFTSFRDLCLHAPQLKFEEIIYSNYRTLAIDEQGELWMFYGQLDKKVGFDSLNSGPLVKHPISLNLMNQRNLRAKKVVSHDSHTYVLAEKFDDKTAQYLVKIGSVNGTDELVHIQSLQFKIKDLFHDKYNDRPLVVPDMTNICEKEITIELIPTPMNLMLRKDKLVEQGDIISHEKLLEGNLRRKAFEVFNQYCSQKVKTYREYLHLEPSDIKKIKMDLQLNEDDVFSQKQLDAMITEEEFGESVMKDEKTRKQVEFYIQTLVHMNFMCVHNFIKLLKNLKDEMNQLFQTNYMEDNSKSLQKIFMNVNQLMLADIFVQILAYKIVPTLESDGCCDRIYFHRNEVMKFRETGECDNEGSDKKTLFGEALNQYEVRYFKKNDISHKAFRAKFEGEDSIDDGGPYRIVLDNIVGELESKSLPVLRPTPNQANDHGSHRECFLLEHNSKSERHMKMFRFLGHLIGYSIRTCAAISINFTSLFWKQLLGIEPNESDLKNIDEHQYNRIQELKKFALKLNDEEFKSIEQYFTFMLDGKEIEVCPNGASKMVTKQNLDEYIKLTLKVIFNQAQVQMEEVKKGALEITGELLLSIMNIRVVKERSFGKETVDLELLKKHTRWNHKESFKEIFWPVLEGFSPEEMKKYLQFICGRGRLPADLTQLNYPHKINTYGGGDDKFPIAHTCYFEMDVPHYSSVAACRKMLKIAMEFCGGVDLD